MHVKRTCLYFYFPLGKGNTGSSSLFYFIINLKITFKIPFLLTKNERVMNNIKTRNNIIKREELHKNLFSKL